MARSAVLPPATRRLFPGYEGADLDLSAATPFFVGRLLEDGDRRDLAWLLRALPESEVAGWLAAHGGRQLSRRSRAFWRLVVGPSPDPDPVAAELWPL